MARKAPKAPKTRAETPAEQRERLLVFANMAAGDPRLSAWEEKFVSDMRRRAIRPPERDNEPAYWRLSAKQQAVIADITAKVDAPIPPEPDDEWDGDEGTEA